MMMKAPEEQSRSGSGVRLNCRAKQHNLVMGKGQTGSVAEKVTHGPRGNGSLPPCLRCNSPAGCLLDIRIISSPNVRINYSFSAEICCNDGSRLIEAAGAVYKKAQWPNLSHICDWPNS